MRLRGNEMICHRGETFTIDRSIRNRDGSPFIVSSEYDNPYLLITVSSTRYDVPNRYCANWWLDLTNLPRFLYTRPKQITSFNVTQVIDEEPGEYLYYVDEYGKREYKYFDENNEWHDYDFRIVHHFTNPVTREWVEQSYVYSIRLVAGQSMQSYIENLYQSYFEVDPPDLSVEELYLKLKAADETLVDGIDYSRPLVGFDVVQVILKPTKFTVMSDINGGL